MKRNLVFFLLILLVSCSEIDSRVSFELSGPRTLRKMAQVSGQAASGYSSFFFFSGSGSFESRPDIQVIFSWKMNDGTYAISSVPITSTRIKFNPKAETPVINFNLKKGKHYTADSYSSFTHDMQSFLDCNLQYLEITVKESDWQPDIRLPLNEEKTAVNK